MPKDDQAVATKKDLQAMETRLVQHFNVVAENLVHDFKGIFKDRLEQHEDRIVRLEQHVGLAEPVVVHGCAMNRTPNGARHNSAERPQA
ncbi:hypothetical protein A3H22_00080 [Candidatus Peribacteria bacterium RIFCSPLOWO2_12_FULL_55_15]|nr:MAG: hypothetical protein A2789_01375 [Candidatus Peribacteria bacterium RIFCSPHIGHO2_01_FULL_54_22]OGJ63094.1 MAG: hypothetical protein A3D12_02630 [Candidatus Peribacteria bacterium RIFCSPHIGHO2_02_FULL_55_24]OGJ64373.1 MAG: hypothetical protein A3E47_01565 [Candidatus Peribacteria bacterium RIFCSPHIGHO2_12_FULL_54_10]OGJ70156.1 MAG: hypothetical protein A3H90_00420 [Candidatus Peribacteria bacterium RIFCSPLOWO2_02_FULL_55_36]OGJ71658.1 MAG: hypothetical protein A3H22_00080 [Candidatus Per